MAVQEAPFPELAFVAAARVYARAHDLRKLASQVGAGKAGYQPKSVSEAELAGVLAKHVAKNVEARARALRIMRRALGDGPKIAGRDIKEIQKEIEGLGKTGQEERARWILALLEDSRAEAWKLCDLLDPGSSGPIDETLARALREERKTLREVRRDRNRLARANAKLEALAERQAEELEQRRREGKQLDKTLESETRRRARAEKDLEAARASLTEAAGESRSLREKLSESGNAGRVRESGLGARERRELLEEIASLKGKLDRFGRDYTAQKSKLRILEDRLEEAWSSGQIEEKGLKPRHPDESLRIEAPSETDDRPPEHKVRLPSVPHHWPGGEERFRRFLVRVAKDPYVKRIVPRRFQSPSQHGITVVTDEGYLLARVSEGDHASQVLIITTATHRGQGEFVRRQLQEVFGDGIP